MGVGMQKAKGLQYEFFLVVLATVSVVLVVVVVM